MASGHIKRGPMAVDVLGKHFTTVANAAARDYRLSRRARGLMVELLSHSDGWITSVDRLVKAGPEGKDAIDTAIRELEAHGYLHRDRPRDERGRLGAAVYEVTDMPDGLTATADPPWKEDTENPRSHPKSENPQQDDNTENPRSHPKSDFPVQGQPAQAHPTQDNPPRKKTSSEGDQTQQENISLSRRGEQADTEDEREDGTDPIAFASSLPGVAGEAEARGLAPLVATAFRKGWPPEALYAHLTSRCDLTRVSYPPAVFGRHLQGIGVPPQAPHARRAPWHACPDCKGSGLAEDSEGKPIGKCSCPSRPAPDHP